jgi:hypothetical protein
MPTTMKDFSLLLTTSAIAISIFWWLYRRFCRFTVWLRAMKAKKLQLTVERNDADDNFTRLEIKISYDPTRNKSKHAE